MVHYDYTSCTSFRRARFLVFVVIVEKETKNQPFIGLANFTLAMKFVPFRGIVCKT